MHGMFRAALRPMPCVKKGTSASHEGSMTLDPTRKHDKLRKALEKTLPSSEFSAEGTNRELEQTTVTDTSSLGPQQYLLKTETDFFDSHGMEDSSPVAGFSTTSVVPPELLGETAPAEHSRFEVTGEAGRGGNARVFRMVDRSLGRTIALKLLRGKARHKQGIKQRFIHEARVTAMLEHPNVVPVYDIGVTKDDRLYFLMKNVTGVSVGDAIRAATNGKDVPLEFRTIEGRLRILLKVCDAIAFAHHKGYIHQDIKPDNLMLGPFGEVLVLDWGCALGENERAAGTVAAFGTPAYMSPEQARRERADERSDVYCLGATLYHMITLHHPTWSDNAEEFWEKKRAGVVDELAEEEQKNLPVALVDIAHGALAPDPAQRYASVTALQNALTAYQEHAESIALARRAAEHLEAAGERGEYRDYTRITIRFEQALEMWEDNQDARKGLVRVRRAHALRALGLGDLALAESVVGDDRELKDVQDRIVRECHRRRRLRKRTRRTVYAVLALGLVLVAALGYYLVDYFRYFGKWQRVYHIDFTAQKPDLDDLFFSYQDLTAEEAPPEVGAEGLLLPNGRMFWAREVRERGDVRVEVVLTWPDKVDGLEIMLTTRREQGKSFAMCPTGYSCQFGGWKGVVNLISRNTQSRFPDQGNSVGCDLRPRRKYTLWFQRVGEELSLFVDRRRVFRVVEPLPLAGEGLEWVGVRSWAEAVAIESFTVWRMGAPEKTSPLIAGDMVAQRGQLRDAAEIYLRVAQDHPGTRLEEQALARAYLASSQVSHSDSLRAKVRAVMQRSHPHSAYRPLLIEADCLTAWREHRFSEALRLGSDALDRSPDSRVALRMISSRSDSIPVWALDSALHLLSRTTKVYGLSLERAGISDITPLEGLPLRSLAVRHNKISDISALRGMPLELLLISSNPVADLSPLEGMDLRVLETSSCEIEDLGPLAGMPLEAAYFADNRVRDLGPLADVPLQDLDLYGNQVESLEPLQGMVTLRRLKVSGNPVADLGPLRNLSLNGLSVDFTSVSSVEPLRGMPLRELAMELTEVSDLRPLTGMPLRILRLSDTPVHSLKPLEGMPLTELRADGCGFGDLSPLAGAPLQALSCRRNQITDLIALTGMPLRELLIDSNFVTDLTPLAGMPLMRLEVKGNPLRSMAPFEDSPPRVTVFDAVTAGPAYMASLLQRWERAGDTVSARLSRTAVAFRRRDTDALIELAVPFEGHRYLYVPVDMSFAQARQAAQRHGGHPVTITTEAEFRLAYSLLTMGVGGWLGIDISRDPPAWLTGEPLTFTNFVTRVQLDKPLPKYMLRRYNADGSWYAATYEEMTADLLIEWEF